ncbi:unnamed protein product [Chironomus riparius]|uniref:Lipase domain-containing protein n=1 Tax=Chironomus riparius TaxID=315576 RepID=A0A9N9RNU2_9DIPT|nr:unnamed protein product [Chironomus riparius]
MLWKSLCLIFALITLVNCDARIRFRFFHQGAAVGDYTTANFFEIISHPNFVRTRQTVMFHHSEDNTLTTPQVQDVLNSYAVNADLNFVMIHYDNANTISTGNSVDLAAGISDSLLFLFNSGYNSGLMSLIGHGLGAQIMARASRNVQTDSNRRHIIGRLTGLDPLDIGLITGLTLGRLSSIDAQWVESVHTESGSFGDLGSNGHIAFFVNGGETQPMCGQTLPGARARCSHEFGMTYWAESVRSAVPIFPSLQCDTWNNFMVGQCNNNFVSYMGRANWSANLRGTYYLQTNIQAPFTRDRAPPF